MLHSFGPAAQLQDRYGEALLFGYHDGGMHMHHPEVAPRLVIIGSASFLNDVVSAFSNFSRNSRPGWNHAWRKSWRWFPYRQMRDLAITVGGAASHRPAHGPLPL